MKFDIHVHTRFSPCSSMNIEDALVQARCMGLDGLCVTDHNTREIENYITEGKQDNGIYVFFGLEYDTPEGDYLVFLPDNCEVCGTDVDAKELLRQVGELGGVAVAAHPLRQGRSVSEYIIREGYCTIIETLNGRNSDHENAGAYKLMRKYRLRACGGSDAHGTDEVGTVYTEFTAVIQSRADLIEALKHGFFWPGVNRVPLISNPMHG